MSKFDVVKDKLKNIDAKKMLEFVKKNVRYFTAGALFILLVVVLVNFTTPNSQVNATDATETTETVATVEEFQENAYPEINALIEGYYTAYAAGDIATLNTLATPISANEQGYISLYSQYVESYQNMVYYTKPGLDANSFLVNVYVEVKFEGVETLAPGLDFFYVRTNEDGTLYIDNLYSQYNMRQNENALDTSVEALINEYEKQDDVVALLQEVQQKYETTVASDEALANMITVTIPNAISEWVATIINQEPSTEQVAEEQATEQPSTEEQPIEGQPADETNAGEEAAEPETPETPSETVTATSTVNVRSAADQSSNKLGQVESGTTLTRIGTEGEWSIVEYNGSTGYIKSEFLTTGTVANEGTASNAIAEGTEITLTSSTNIREGMSETSDKVGLAYAGEKVTVVMSYAEGWTKVTWKNKTGYIKTDLLQ